MALSLLIVFLYGSMVWGMFPFIGSTISYESHMLGAVTGVILALWYRDEGPQRPMPEWMDETDISQEENEARIVEADIDNQERSLF
jgi:hypothetical protein